MIFSAYYDAFKAQIIFNKQQEYLKLRKKQIFYNQERLASSEPPRIITQVKIGQDGSMWTYLKDGKYPIGGYPDQTTVNIITIYKKVLMLLVNNLESQNWLQRLITLWAVKINFNALPDWFTCIFNHVEVLLKDEYWCRPVKEIRRVLKGRIDDKLIDALSLILEYDSAYRYRFQDVIVELGEVNVKNILKLFDILTERDYLEMGVKWQKFKKYLKLLFILQPKIKNEVLNILSKLNIDEVKMSKEDTYWVRQFPTFKYQGLTLEERLKLNEVG